MSTQKQAFVTLLAKLFDDQFQQSAPDTLALIGGEYGQYDDFTRRCVAKAVANHFLACVCNETAKRMGPDRVGPGLGRYAQ